MASRAVTRGAASRRKGRSSRSTVKSKQQDILLVAVVLLIVFAISVLMMVALLGFGGAFGVGSRVVLFGVFGIFAYLFPPGLLGGTVFAIRGREEKNTTGKIVSAIVAYVLTSLLLELFLHGDKPIGGLEAFAIGQSAHTGGGLIGGFFSNLLVRMFGLVGAYVLAFAGIAICLVLLTENVPFSQREENEMRRKPVRQAPPKKPVQRQRPERTPGKRDEKEKPVEQEQQIQDTFAGKAPERRRRFMDISGATTILPQHGPGSDEVSEIRFEEEEGYKEQEEQQESTIKAEAVSEKDIIKERAEEENGKDIETETEIEAEKPVLIEEDSGSGWIREELLDPERELKPRHVEDKSEDAAEPAPLFLETPAKEEIREDIKEEINETRQTEAVTEAKEAVFDAGQERKEPEAAEEKVSVAADEAPGDNSEYMFPTTDLLTKQKSGNGSASEKISETAEKLEQTLANFGVRVTITDATCGPTVTRYELQPEMGVKVSKIVNLADDIKLNLAAEDIRIEAPIPGKAAVGIEVPNRSPSVVSFRELMESPAFINEKSPIAFAAGKDIAGNIMVSDIARMPHVLIAGATGSGKSVCINTIIMSILFKAHPDDVKFIMIDPKVVELSVYNGIPHLLVPVVTDPRKAAGALHWAVKEMMDRYDRFAKAGVRDMKGYNARIRDGVITYEQGDGRTVEAAASKMPQIIVIVDELADLMMVSSNEVEEAICRLAQLARAAGIHLVIATQRPSVNVITGLIKANMPSRIAFAVTSGVDSRTILDMTGAEKLLGKGDMLYYPQGLTKPLRVQGAFVTDEDVAKVVDFIRNNNKAKGYDPEVITQVQESQTAAENAVEIGNPDRSDDKDKYYDEAARLLIDKEKGSIGMLQRYFKIGFNRAARIMDQLEEGGVVGPEEGTKPRRILMTLEQYENLEGETEGKHED